MTESAWRALETELDVWSERGRVATFWWRDDDASGPSARLERLLHLQSRHGVALSLAVIPERVDRTLALFLEAEEGVAVLQHGFAHRNHAAAGEKSMELGLHRPAERVQDDLRRGFECLESVFEEHFLPVLVPPWNRIAAGLLPFLPRLGLRGLSAFTPRSRPEAAPGLREVNCHVDLIDWRGGRRGRDHAVLAGEVAAHLRARREGRADAEEPTGLLTHHLDHDEGAWAFVEEFLDRVSGHPSVCWPLPRDLFPPRPTAEVPDSAGRQKPSSKRFLNS